jgi:hypothetical protein
LLRSSSVPLARRERAKIQFGPRVGADGVTGPVVAPVFTWAPGKIAPKLVGLCPPDLDRIDSLVPPEIVTLLADPDFPGWRTTQITFDENDVLDRLRPTDADAVFPWPNEATWRDQLGNPRIVREHLDVLGALFEKEAPTPEELEGLRRGIHLPDTRGTARRMSDLFIGNDLPPALAAFEMPALLNAALAKHPLFRRRDWKLPVYSFEAFLEKVDFSKQSEETRRAFWTWLRMNWRQVPTRSAARLAALPIWPTRGGETRVLRELFLPTSPKVAAVLSEAIYLPAADVQGFRMLHRKGRGALVLRSAPTPAELQAYYSARFLSFPRHRQLTVEEADNFRRFERELATLSGERQIAVWLARQSALGLSRDRQVKLVPELHRSTPQILRVALIDEDLLDRAAPSLDRLWPARSEPSLAATVRAISADPQRADALIPRLKALAAALRRADSLDQPIAHVPCIPQERGFLPPAQLALKGNRGDYWGDWKVSLSAKGLSADEQSLYRLAGVTSGEPDFGTSLKFFQWLNEQSPAVVARHLEAVIRHFAHVRGVRQWWESYPDLPCVPVRVGQVLRLVSRRRALRANGPVYLPDFDELAATIRDQSPNERVALVIDRHPNVIEPITQMLRDAGVRSLRAAAARPFSVTGENPTPAADSFQVVQHLRSSKMENLRKRLVALDFMKPLRAQWRSRLEQVQSVMTASHVHASFLVGRRTYRIESESGFDERTRTIWLKRSASGHVQEALFQALAERVFDELAPRFAACVLQQAVRQEFREAQPLFVVPGAAAENEVEKGSDSVGEPEPGETSQTHRPSEPDPSKNLPRPGPIPQTAPAGSQRGSRTAAGKARPKEAPTRNPVELEDLHRAELKQNQYAWHCQVCLAMKSPRDLAPEGSYVALAENRRKLIEAHHADQVHASGARHAGNLVVLCHYHHHQLGNALSREQLTRSLAATTVTKKVTFFAGGGDQSRRTVAGHIAAVRPASTGSLVRFFFTTSHREHWLQTSPQDARISSNAPA